MNLELEKTKKRTRSKTVVPPPPSVQAPRFPSEIPRSVLCLGSDGFGGTCGSQAELGHLCKAHAREEGLEIKPSRFGGLGLFAAGEEENGPVFRKGDSIGEYGGRTFLTDKVSTNGSLYVMVLDGKRSIDAAESTSCLIRFANDGTKQGLNNSEFIHYANHAPSLLCDAKGRPVRKKGCIWLEATRKIFPGEEILVGYGDDYWSVEDEESRL